jgi:hypothetical protein
MMKKFFRYILLSIGLISIDRITTGADFGQGLLILPTTKARMLEVLDLYRKSRPTITDWGVQQNPDGTLQTEWYRDHKGEVILRIKVAFLPDATSIMVSQKIPWLVFLSKEVSDTDWTRKTAEGLAQMTTGRN